MQGGDIVMKELNINIRLLNQSDLPSVALLYVAAFPDSALTKLGVEAVRRYYEWQLIGPHDVDALGAFYNDRLVGFCFAGIFRGAMSGFLQRNWLFLTGCVLIRPWLILNPVFRDRVTLAINILRRLLRQFIKRRRKTSHQSSSHSSEPSKSYRILSIAVNPNYQGLGIGKMLMEYSEAIAREKGFLEMNLTVDPKNEKAIRFYERLGWEKILNEGKWTGKMRKRLEKG